MKNTTTILLIVGIILLVNFLSNRFFHRFDLTEGGQFTLSKATKDILRDLNEPVTVKAYFSENMPPQLENHKREVQDMLIEYNNLSRGNVVYEFIDPSTSPELEQEAAQSGIPGVPVGIREKDKRTQQVVYLGAMLEMGDQKEVIPIIQPGTAMEYALSTSIKKISVIDKPIVGLVQGHGEPAMGELAQVYQQLSVLYSLQNLDLNQEIPAQYKTIAIIAPRDSFPPQHFATLDQFLGRGGNIFIANNSVDGDFSTGQGNLVTTGLEGWLQDKGLMIEPAFITDEQCGSVSVQRGGGFFSMRQQIPFPYLPKISNFADHPISKGLEQVDLQFASPISFSGNKPNAVFTPFARTSKKSGTASLPLMFDVQKSWTNADFPLSDLVVGAILEDNFIGDIPAKIVLISDGDFATNGPQQQQQRRLNEDNINLMTNSIDWLSDDTGLIDLRTKGVNSRPIAQLEDGERNAYKYTNFLLPLLLVVIYGLFRSQRRRKRRMKQMQESYL